MKTKYLLGVLASAILLSAVLAGCKKDSPYYNFQNTEQVFSGDAVSYLQSQPNTYDSLLKVLERLPDVKQMLINEEVTLFAPTNTNFVAAMDQLNADRKAANKPLINLDNATVEQLDTMTCKYIIAGKMTTDNFKPFLDGVYVKSVKFDQQMHIQYKQLDASGYVSGGPQVLVFSDTKNSTVKNYWERLETRAVNIKTNNAIIHTVGALHSFGFNEFSARLNN